MFVFNVLNVSSMDVAVIGNSFGLSICIVLVLVLFTRCYLLPLFWGGLATNFLKSDNYSKSIGAFDHALKLSPRDARLWFAKGVALRRLGHLDDALASLEKARSLAPDQLRISQELVQIYRESRRYDDALAALDRLVDFGGAKLEVMLTRCAIEIDAQRFCEAEKSCDLLIATDDETLAPQAYVLRGIARLMLGRTEDSLADFEISYLLNPRSIETRVYCAATWLRRQMYEETIVLCDSILNDSSTNALAYHIRGTAKRAIGLIEQGDQDLKKAIELKLSSL